jgi:hypothetical protein
LGEEIVVVYAVKEDVLVLDTGVSWCDLVGCHYENWIWCYRKQ